MIKATFSYTGEKNKSIKSQSCWNSAAPHWSQPATAPCFVLTGSVAALVTSNWPLFHLCFPLSLLQFSCQRTSAKHLLCCQNGTCPSRAHASEVKRGRLPRRPSQRFTLCAHGVFAVSLCRAQAVINTMCGFGVQAQKYLEANKLIYPVGCADRAVVWIESHLLLVGALALGLALPQVPKYVSSYYWFLVE